MPHPTGTAPDTATLTRRSLLAMVGKAGGGTALYQAMASLGFAAESSYRGPVNLQGAPKGTTVLVLGAGMAGLVAAYELRRAGYTVKVLEYNARAGGRAWTLRGGDHYEELGGFQQHCAFDKGQYFNPGPWRIPHHHYGILDYAGRLGVALEPFMQVNHNAYVHGKKAFGGKPQRYRHVQADYQGHVAELLSKAINTHQLDAPVSKEDQDLLLESLRGWGALDKDFRYTASSRNSDRRGFDVQAGGGLMPLAVPSTPLQREDLLRSRLWECIAENEQFDHQTTIFQPVGGMDQIAQALYRQVKGSVQFHAKVTKIDQSTSGVTVTYVDATGKDATERTAKADWCLCTIPLSILSQIDITVGPAMQAAIQAVPYGAAFKAGLQFKRRFWEQDDRIYGGITYTDLPISKISYPCHGYGQAGKGVLLGAYAFGANAFEFTAMEPTQRLQEVVRQGSQIHPQYAQEFEHGMSVGWHRVPWSHGCFALWNDATRATHYNNLCQIDGRIALAGEHASYLPAWQEGAVLSSLDAIGRMHARIIAGA